MRVASFSPAEQADRDDATAFVGRVARWDPAGPVRLRTDPVDPGEAGQGSGTVVRQRAGQPGRIRLYATTPFDTLVARAVNGVLEPRDITVHAGNLLSALAVSARPAVDPGPVVDAAWRTQLPPLGGWIEVDVIPARVLASLADEGVSRAKDRPGPTGGASTSLLDSEVLTVTGGGMNVPVPLRMLFALSGMGFAPASAGEDVRISATDSWVRIDARFGAVLRRRHSLLPLLF